MTKSVQDQTLAIAGVFQSALLVDELARQGQISPTDLEIAVSSIFNTAPQSAIDIYSGEVSNLRQGLNGIRALLSRDTKGLPQDVVRYAMGIMHIEGKVRENKALLNKLSEGIERSRGQKEYFDNLIHDSVIGSLANTYIDTISTLSFRIQVTGNPTLLQDERIASRIRTLLLAGIRSAFLWHQSGGHRWHFLFRRGLILRTARQIQTQGLQ
ncbi:high frequency lysogenization protein HflD [Gynuella sp.]|uniref:high frequency lysogenization protein HflD n=1 Tax=Gynuella sp. TaxID=2969146 RepID=UPI003D0A174A